MKSKTLNVCTLDALIDKVSKEPAINFIYPGIAPGSIGIIFGPSKSGKTTFCENLAMSIASGATSYLGKSINCMGRKILFISLEEFYQGRTVRNAKQVNSIAKPFKKWSDNYLVADDAFPRHITNKEEMQKLEACIKEVKPNIVFIDSLTRLYDGSIEDSAKAKQIMLELREMGNRLKVTLVLIHHTPKINVDEPLTITSIAGSRVVAQEVDFAIGVNKNSKNRRYIKEVGFRYSQENEDTVTEFKINEHLWLEKLGEVSESMLSKEADGRVDNTNKDLVLQVAKKLSNGQQLLIPFKDFEMELVKTGKMTKPTLSKALGKNVADGNIIKSNKGLYKLAS